MSHAATLDDHAYEAPTNTGIHNKKLAMWAFLASDCMFFGTLISTHLIYRRLDTSDLPVTEIFALDITSISTFVLLVSSYLMAMSVSAMHQAKKWEAMMYLAGVITFGLVFLGFQKYEFTHFVHGQGWYEWSATNAEGETLRGTEGNGNYFKDVADVGHAEKHFAHELEQEHPGYELATFEQIKVIDGLTLQNHIFGSTFYVLTGIHGCHVAIGVIWLGLLWLFMFFGKAGTENAIDVEVAGLYWHFVDIVWIAIFTAVYLFEYI